MPPVVGAVVAGIVVVLTGLGGSPAAAATPAVPETMAGYSHLTGSVSSSPPGPAVALWQHGYGVEFLDFPQAVVLGAGGDSYRRVDVAEERAGSETQGDPAPMLLSPDGTRVAVGDHDVERPDVVVVDLTTGDDLEVRAPRGPQRRAGGVVERRRGAREPGVRRGDEPLLRRADHRLDRPARPP